MAPRTTPKHLDLSTFLPYLVNRVGVAVATRFTNEALGASHLTIAHWRVLAALSNNGGIRQVDLAEMTSIEVSTVSRLVTRLVRLGLVTRVRSTTSNREVVVQLSPKGKTVVTDIIPVALRLEEIAVEGVSKSDLATTKRVLRQAYLNLKGRAAE